MQAIGLVVLHHLWPFGRSFAGSLSPLATAAVVYCLRTRKVYKAAAARLVDGAIDGSNGLLVIAGTRGSGRSHTLWGKPPSAAGLLPTSIDSLVRAHTRVSSMGASSEAWILKLCVSEIDNGEARDLIPANDVRLASPQRWCGLSAALSSLSPRGMLGSVSSPSRSSRDSGRAGSGGSGRRSSITRAERPVLLTSRALGGALELAVEDVYQALGLIREVMGPSDIPSSSRA